MYCAAKLLLDTGNKYRPATCRMFIKFYVNNQMEMLSSIVIIAQSLLLGRESRLIHFGGVTFAVSLNNSPLCTLHNNPSTCATYLTTSSAVPNYLPRTCLSNILSDTKHMFSSQQSYLVLSVLSIFNYS